MRATLVSLSLISGLCTGPATGAVIFSDGFDAENGGITASNYTGFAHWTVSDGSVDIIKSGDYGLPCHGGSGACVDLDGSSGDAGILKSSNLAFSSGDLVEISFRLSGNQRSGFPTDSVAFRLVFGQITDVLGLTKGGAFAASGPSNLYGITGTTDTLVLASSDPYGLFELSFVSATTGLMAISFENAGGDNVGAMLDTVTVSVQPHAAPEPSAWSLAMAGLGCAGLARARRRGASAAAGTGIRLAT